MSAGNLCELDISFPYLTLDPVIKLDTSPANLAAQLLHRRELPCHARACEHGSFVIK